MVLPGWNVTEPVQVALLFIDFIRKVRDVPTDIAAFATQVKTLRSALLGLDECLKNPSAHGEDYDGLRSAAEDIERVAEDCQSFLEKFFEENYEKIPGQTDDIGFRTRLGWFWHKDKAKKLTEDISTQIALLNMRFNIFNLRDRQRLDSIGSAHAQDGSRPTTTTKPVTPATHLGLTSEYPSPPPSWNTSIDFERRPSSTHGVNQTFSTSTTLNATSASESEWTTNTPFMTRRHSSMESVPLEILQKSDPTVEISALTRSVALNELKEAFIVRGDKRLPIVGVDVIKDSSHRVLYIITQHKDPSVKFFHRIKEWPLSVPHSEHPCAYKKQNTYVVKFLEPQDLYSARWTESRSSRCSISSSAGSERIPSSAGTPATVALSASPGSPTDIGSPIISPASFEIKKQTGRPVYEFQQDKDYKGFLKTVMGKILLVHVPIKGVASKCNKREETRESELQYLQLWADGDCQEIMYYANCRKPSAEYRKFDFKFFSIHDAKPSSAKLQLIKKQGSSLYFQDGLPTDLQNIKYLTITFSEVEGKASFLKQTTFKSTTGTPADDTLGVQPP